MKDKLTKDQAREAIEKYYAEHLACGVKIDVKDLTITEREGGGRTVNATVIFLEKTTGNPEPIKLAIPENDGQLDWTTTTLDASGPHESEPAQDSSPSQELDLPKGNQKPDEAAAFEGPEGEYIQKPEKVGSEIPKKAKKAKESGYDADGWPNPGQVLEEGGTEASTDTDDWLVMSDRGDVPVEADMPEVQTLTESSTGNTSSFPVGEDTEEVMKMHDRENANDLALLEYVSTVEVESLGKRLHGLKFTFADSLTQDTAIRILEKLDEVVEVEKGEGTEVGVVVQQLAEDDNPGEVLREMVGDLASVNIGWEEGHEAKYNEALSDNSGFYHKGVQTTANEPATPSPNAGADTVGGEEGGDKQTHKGVSKQGGAGVGKTKPAAQKKLKLKGSKAESITEQGFLDDIVSFDDEGDAGGDDVDVDIEVDSDQAMPVVGELDPVIAELVRAQAENGLDTVMQVAQAHAEESGLEWDEATEQAVRDAYATAVGDQEPEDELDVDVDAELEPEADDVEIDVGNEPFESVQEADGDADKEDEKDDKEEKDADTDEKEKDAEPEEKKEEPDPSAETDVIGTDAEATETEAESDETEGEEEDEIEEKKPPLGSGERFKKLKKEIGAKGDVRDPGAVAAAIGRKKYGKEKFQKMAAKGRKAASQKVDPEQTLTASEANDQYEMGLTGDQVKALGKALFKAVALEAAMKDENKKAGIIEQVIAKANERLEKISESAQNPNTIGGKETYKRVKGKNKAATPFGWVKPGVKFMGQIRVVWDDGHESWEKPGDVTAVSNPRNNKTPSGGATKPGSQKTDKAGGEELDMIKNLESIGKENDRSKRFRKMVELAVKVAPKELPEKAVEILTEGWDEFEHDELSMGLTSLFESKQPAAKTETKPVNESESEDNDSIQVISEDFGEDGDQITTIDLE